MKKEHGNSNYDVELSSPLNNNDENMKNIKQIGFKFAAVFAILFGIIILITSIIWCFNYLYKTVRLKGLIQVDFTRDFVRVRGHRQDGWVLPVLKRLSNLCLLNTFVVLEVNPSGVHFFVR